MENIPVTIFQYICRTCLIYSDNDLYPMDEIEIENVQLREIIKSRLSLPIQFGKLYDQGPQNMCKRCILKMYEVQRFLKQCESCQEYLGSVLKERQSKKSNLVAIKLVQCGVTNPNIVNYLLVTPTSQNPATSQGINNVNLKCSTPLRFNGNSLSVNNVNTVENSLAIKNEEIDLNNFEIKKEETPSEAAEEEPSFTEECSDLGASVTKPGVKHKWPHTIGTVHRLLEYECKECSEKFRNKLELQAHWLNKDHYPDERRCNYCRRGSRNNYTLENHIRTHTGERPHVCDICGKRFIQSCSYLRHKLIHTGDKRFKCGWCNKGFIRKENLTDHERKAHNRDRLLCQYCGKDFCFTGVLSKHEAGHAKQQVNIKTNVPFQCNICGEILSFQEALDLHKKWHRDQGMPMGPSLEGEDNSLGVKRNFCKYCDTRFKRWGELRQHQLNSDCTKFIKQYICHLCGKSCFSKAPWYVHLRMHRDETKNVTYKCKFCDEQFRNHVKYKFHLFKHTRQRKHGCAICGSKFYTRQNLEVHIRVHTGERPFVCDICNKSFPYECNRTEHRKLHFTKLKSCKCELCGSAFRDIRGLRKHRIHYHTAPAEND